MEDRTTEAAAALPAFPSMVRRLILFLAFSVFKACPSGERVLKKRRGFREDRSSANPCDPQLSFFQL
jgi:hypothetical protein